MSLNAFIKIGKAEGESRQAGYVGWMEIQGWEWECEAESSWVKGGGASVGKPNPGKFTFEHYYDKGSSVLLGFLVTGSAFSEVHMHMCKSTGDEKVSNPFFEIKFNEAFITKVSNSANDNGDVVQKIDMVFKEITILYRQQLDAKTAAGAGKFAAPTTFNWNIPAGMASPGAFG